MRLNRYDAFTKPIEGLVSQNSFGGFFTILGAIVTVILFSNELYQFIKVDTNEHLLISPSNGNTQAPLPIRLHVTFPHLTCNEIHLDLANTKADDIDEGTKAASKRRTASRGWKSKKNSKVPVSKRRPNRSERKTLKSKGFYYEESDRGNPDSSPDVGCTIDGVINAGRVGGSFRVVLTENVWSTIALMGLSGSAQQTNVSHYIHDISFGTHFPRSVNPLADLSNGIKDGIGLAQFFLKVVPTKYKRPARTTMETFQISMTENFVKMTTLLLSGTTMQQPGVTFSYDFSPMEVVHVEEREGIFSFLGSLVAVTGGIFVTVRLISSCLLGVVGGAKKFD